jgi:hypothetical protein
MLPLARGSMKGYTFPERSEGKEPTPPRQPMKGNLYLDLLGIPTFNPIIWVFPGKTLFLYAFQKRDIPGKK